jgi:ankyrin repeat protein
MYAADFADLKALIAVTGIDIKAKDMDGFTALMRAVMNKNEANVAALISTDGINVNAADNSGYTPLKKAQLLLLNETDENAKTKLTNIIQTLKDHGGISYQGGRSRRNKKRSTRRKKNKRTKRRKHRRV